MFIIFVPVSCVLVVWVYVLFINFQLNRHVVFIGVYMDEVSLFMIYIASFVMFISFFCGLTFLRGSFCTVFIFMLVVCCYMFVVDNMFIFYLLYEDSLVPILFVIMKWGSYPERSVRSIILLVYTSVFTLPFVYVLFVIFTRGGRMRFSLWLNSSYLAYPLKASLVFSFIIFFTFSVKLPIYGLHFWLPIAHVEAPTFGSIILAGILLKLGGVGLVRFIVIINIQEIKLLVIGYLFVFICFVTVLCAIQSDFKRLVAYSSVSHIMGVPIMLISSSMLGIKGLIRVMFLHGIRSPLIFMFVGLIYETFNTRQHFLMRGLINFSPLIRILLTLSFFFTLSTPPFPSFLPEVFIRVVSLHIWSFSFLFLFLFFFFSIVYNLIWFTSILFLNSTDYSVNFSFSFSFCFFLPIFLRLFIIPIFFSLVFFIVY